MALNAWPLVGRDEELRLVAEAIDRDEAHGVVLAGAVGVGKSRLAAEVVTQARRQGHHVEEVVATRAAASVPFGALAHLLPAAHGSRVGRLEILRQVGRLLAERSRGRCVVLSIDDAHLLDPGSAALALQLARTATAFVVVTVRTEEPAPDAIVALWKDGLAVRIELQPLAEAEVASLLALGLGGPIEAATLYRLVRATAGNVLFLRELVHEGLDGGRLAIVGGVWRWRGPLAPTGGLLSIIEDRLRRLQSSERRLLEVVALGEPLESAVLERVTGGAVRWSAANSGLVVEHWIQRRSEVRMRHPLYGEVLRESLPPLRAREVMRLLADALESVGSKRGDDLLRVAAWRQGAGQRLSVTTALSAAGRAQALFDYELAERLAQAAVDAGGGVPARLAVADALIGQHRAQEAETVLAEIGALAETDGQRARTAMARAPNLLWGLGAQDRAEAVLTAAAAAITDTRCLDELLAVRANLRLFYAPMSEVLEDALALLERDTVEDRLVAQCANAASLARSLGGDFEQADVLIARGLAAVRRRTDELPLGEAQFLAIRWWRLWLAGRLREARTLVVDALREAVENRARDLVALWSAQLGCTDLLCGRPASALARSQEAAVLMQESDRWGQRYAALAVAAQSAAILGDGRTAEAALAEAEASSPAFRSRQQVWVHLARAWVVGLSGGTEAGSRYALEAADLARDLGMPALEVLALHHVARHGAAHLVSERMAALVGRVQGDLAPVCAAHATALVQHDPAKLDEVGSRFQALGLILDAVEAASEAAEAYRRDGQAGRARRARVHAAELMRHCEGAKTPALMTLEVAEVLTAREKEIASLAARGMTSPAIAEHLGLSVRTVNNHLQQVFDKLDVGTRRELGPILLTHHEARVLADRVAQRSMAGPE